MKCVSFDGLDVMSFNKQVESLTANTKTKSEELWHKIGEVFTLSFHHTLISSVVVRESLNFCPNNTLKLQCSIISSLMENSLSCDESNRPQTRAKETTFEHYTLDVLKCVANVENNTSENNEMKLREYDFCSKQTQQTKRKTLTTKNSFCLYLILRWSIFFHELPLKR